MKDAKIQVDTSCPHCHHTLSHSEIVKLLRQLDKHKKQCQTCHKEFIGSNSAKTCSNACRSKAYRQRKAALSYACSL